MEFNSVAEAKQYIYKLSPNESTLRYRGQADFDWSLAPSIHRYIDLKRYQTIIHESFLIKQKPPKPIPPITHTEHDLEWLMICQHYGIPTRLLDWTSDIEIALLFACSDDSNMEVDGSLFICDSEEYPLYLFEEKLKEEQKLSFARTSIKNPRMRTQSGSFMIWGLAPLSNDVKESYDLWEYRKANNENSLLKKILIPKASKRRILAELKEVYSITIDSLYLKGGYIEKNFSTDFVNLKETLRLATLYQTDADRLTELEEKKARKLFKIECRNWRGENISLSKY